VSRAEVEDIRGVACGDMIRTLLEKGLVRVTGRGEQWGRPLLYGTTRKFLQAFGLASVKDLPSDKQLVQP
jgi:segregation and condensation protein B